MIGTREIRSILTQHCPSVTFSTTDLTSTSLGSSPVLHGKSKINPHNIWRRSSGIVPTSQKRVFIQMTHKKKKRELLKNPTKIDEIQEKKIIDRNWNITTCLLRDNNPNYQCLKITSCRWRRPPRTHSFTATTHFKSSRSFVSLCVCCMLCRMRLCRILQIMQHTHRVTQKNGNFWNA